MPSIPENEIDKSALSISGLADKREDKNYWLTQSPGDRIRHIEYLRLMNYGNKATARLQRVLEITELKRS